VYGVHILVYGVDMATHDIAPQPTANTPTAERLLETARRILLDEGSEAISMRRVAQGAGSPGRACSTRVRPARH